MRIPEEEVSAGDLDFLQEEINGIAEDVLDLEDNIDKVADILEFLTKACKSMTEAVEEQDEEIKRLRRVSFWNWILLFVVAVFVWIVALT